MTKDQYLEMCEQTGEEIDWERCPPDLEDFPSVVVDFLNIMPGSPKAKVRSRIILTPQHAKRFVKALNDNVQRFEKAHGEIKDYEQPPIPLNFGPPGEA